MPRPRPSVILFAYYFPPAIASGAARAGRIAKYLERFGYHVHVVCASEGQSANEQGNVTRVPSPAGHSILDQMLSWLMRAVQGATKLYGWKLPWVPYSIQAGTRRMNGTPVVISTFPPVATHFSALYLKRRYGVKWIADFRDPLGIRAAWNFLRTPLEKMIFAHADVVIANTDTIAETWRSRYPQWASKIEVIWNGFDPEETVPIAVESKREHKVLTHVGEIYGKRHPGNLLASFDRLIARGCVDAQGCRIRFVGPIEAESGTFACPSFQKLVQVDQLEYDNRSIPRADALRVAAESDFLLVLDATPSKKAVQVPAKLFDCLRIGRPILATTTPDSPTERILSKSGVPHVCIYPQDGESEVDRKLLAFLSLSSEPAMANEWFWETFDGAQQIRALASVIDELSGVESGVVEPVAYSTGSSR